MEKLTLKSGREVEYTKPNFEQRADMIDLTLEYYNKGVPLSMKLCGKIVIDCRMATREQLNNNEFSYEELYEIGEKIRNEFYLSQLNKKKLK